MENNSSISGDNVGTNVMYISTLHLDELLEELDPEEDSVLYGFAQTLKDMVSGVTDGIDEIESKLDSLEKRLTNLE